MMIPQFQRQPNPYLRGNYAPVDDECSVFDLEVVGRIPDALEGRLIRNGPNPIQVTDAEGHHWFSGEGMVHGVRLRGGRAEWYRNRWVQGASVSRALGTEPVPGPERRLDSSPNTNVLSLGGRAWALVEAGDLPVSLGYELQTVAREDFFGTLARGFTAHPKIDPSTGSMHGMCYAWDELEGRIEYVVIGPDARVSHVAEIPLPGPSMVHDMSITETSALIYDLPVTLDPDRAAAGAFPYRWNPDYGARVGVLPLGGTAEEIVWCEVSLGYVYHPVNAYDDGDCIVVDVIRYPRMFDQDTRGPWGDGLPMLERWTIDPLNRRVREETIDERPMEFPRVPDSLVGRRHRYSYCAGLAPNGEPAPTYKHDLRTGEAVAHEHGPGRGTSEPAFVPRPGARDEDDGWLLSYVYDAGADRSEVVILDARDLQRPPEARVLLPRRVPFGFHGNWIPDHAMGPAPWGPSAG